MDIQDLNKQLKSLHARGVDLNRTYSWLFDFSSYEQNLHHLDICLTPLEWACCNGDIGLVKKLMAYHFSRDYLNDSDNTNINNFRRNLDMSLKYCIESKQEKCFELLLDIGADPLQKLQTACGVDSTVFEEACGLGQSHGPKSYYLDQCLKRGYCSTTALIDLVSTPGNISLIGKVLKLNREPIFLKRPESKASAQAMVKHCTPARLMDACHWTNVKCIVDNIPQCKELIHDQITKCKVDINRPVSEALIFAGRGQILDKIDVLNQCLGIDKIIV